MMMMRTTDPMMMFNFMFCHHIFLATLRDETRNSSARFDSNSVQYISRLMKYERNKQMSIKVSPDLPSKLSNRCPLSRILLMFSVMMFETSLTWAWSFFTFSSDWFFEADALVPPGEVLSRLWTSCKQRQDNHFTDSLQTWKPFLPILIWSRTWFNVHQIILRHLSFVFFEKSTKLLN